MFAKNPTTLIVNGASWLGEALVQVLLENKGKVIVVDDFNEKNLGFIKRFSSNYNFIFLERSKVDSLKNDFGNIKYIIHLQNDFNKSNNDVSSKKFIAETKFIDQILTIALEKNSHYILVSSMRLHKEFILKKTHIRNENVAYTEADLQDYFERAVLEYHHKSGLNARIVRLANVYGPGMDVTNDPILNQIMLDALTKDYIRVKGDGLEYSYYVYLDDAVQGILKALFTPNVSGQIFSISNFEEISVLSIANKILNLRPKAKRIQFIKSDNDLNPLYERAYIPDQNLSEIGWKPRVSFERGLSNLFEFYKKDFILRHPEITIEPVEYVDTNADIYFNFDNTINLSDTVYGNVAKHDKGLYDDFSKKLYDTNPPIYNINTQIKLKNGYELAKELSEDKPHFFKFLIFVTIIVSVTFIIILPGVRIGIVYQKLNRNLDTLLKNTFTYNDSISEESYRADFSESLATIQWLMPIIGQEETKDKIMMGLEGVDKSIKIYNRMKEQKVYFLLNSPEPLSEEEYLIVKSIYVDSIQALNDINNFDDVQQLPNSLKSKINELEKWLQNNIDLASSKVSSY